MTENGEKRVYGAACGESNRTFVVAPDGDRACLIWQGRLHLWAPGGYEPGPPVEPDRPVQVLTSWSIVRALAAGYRPVVHSSATASVEEAVPDGEESEC
jgi:hypothetical protein